MVVGELVYEKDLVIIGAGPGGYQAAIRAAKHGRDVTLIDRSRPGGECLHSGCIPSKLLAVSAGKLNESAPGLTISASFSMKQWNDEKRSVITNLEKGLYSLFKKNKIELIQGNASFLSEERIGVEQGEKFEVWSFNHAIIATGSSANAPSFYEEHSEFVRSVEELYSVEGVPETLLLYGADYMTAEVASSFRAIGSSVHVITDEESFLPDLDETIAKEVRRQFKKQGIRVSTGLTDIKLVEEGSSIKVTAQDAKGEGLQVFGDLLGYSAGRVRNLEALGLENARVKVTEDNFIDISESCQSSNHSIYACGDITDGPSLAVKAIKQGKVAADNCCGFSSVSELNFLPIVIHTLPPVASVGLTEKEADVAGYHVSTGVSHMRANGFATLHAQPDGLVKVVRDEETHLLLGFHAIGKGAIELIEKGTLALEMVARDEDFIYPYAPHPGFGEAWIEATELSLEASKTEFNKQKQR
ncbi:dihydrolipoyl dehydrogenase family protein [Guptibacillus algicola]|uniref:dihydrolipoyl dehydrogenase family protein n=1 Tax=Guptibacillus algicola TaxID=225844 RepID=UPI001CD51BFF|nr:NAD(P)/FAD-dependent oxidoreductase [Alkalihalobacillus algicola]MCA0989133.1 NAD(P)/FAD-dependent oxidoreductase [Alkalihalobacillus algicola]